MAPILQRAEAALQYRDASLQSQDLHGRQLASQSPEMLPEAETDWGSHDALNAMRSHAEGALEDGDLRVCSGWATWYPTSFWGTRWLKSLPAPSCPESPRPQKYSSPVLAMAQAWFSPLTMQAVVTLPSPGTAVKRLQSRLSPVPSCPKPL